MHLLPCLRREQLGPANSERRITKLYKTGTGTEPVRMQAVQVVQTTAKHVKTSTGTGPLQVPGVT